MIRRRAAQLAHNAGLLNDGAEIRRLAELLAHEGVRTARRRSSRGRSTRSSSLPTPLLRVPRQLLDRGAEYDKAVEPLIRAGELADNGEPFVRLAEVYFQQEDWSHAAEMLERGFGKGNLKRPGNAQLLMGLALYNQKKLQDARAWFERASAHSESHAQAQGWLQHTVQELGG